jgi:hypothetical protein
MKAMMSGCLAVACAMMFAACAVDSTPDQSASTDTSTTSADLSVDTTSDVVHVPPELRLSPDELDAASANDATPNACHVTLQFCRDPNTHLPSYCSNGCAANEAAIRASSLCFQTCGNINCTNLTNHGGC